MPPKKVIQVTSIFLSALFAGIGAVYAIGFSAGLFVRMPTKTEPEQIDDETMVAVEVQSGPVAEEPEVSEDVDSEEFKHHGYFFPNEPYDEFSKVKLPDVFVINSPEIQDEDDSFGTSIMAADEDSETRYWTLTDLKIEGDKIKFRTHDMNNIRFEFSGRFLVDDGAVVNPGKTVMNGEVRRYNNERLAGKAKQNYSWTETYDFCFQ
jgi:hypothetical protein